MVKFAISQFDAIRTALGVIIRLKTGTLQELLLSLSPSLAISPFKLAPTAAGFTTMAAADATHALPGDSKGQVYVTVHAFVVGGLWFPVREVFQDSLHEPETVGSNIPFIAFMVTHPTKGRALFDLGLRKASSRLF